MKKIIAISFLLLLTFSQLGYYCIYRFQQELLKEEMETKLFTTISEDALEIFELEKNAASIIWEKEGHEFTLHGELYDVAKIKKGHGKTLLYCINDKKEQQLLLDYSKALKSAADQPKSGKIVLNFYMADFLSPVIEKNIGFTIVVKKKIFDFNSALSSSDKEINTPPPKGA